METKILPKYRAPKEICDSKSALQILKNILERDIEVNNTKMSNRVNTLGMVSR